MGCFLFGCIYQTYAPKMSTLHVHGACSCNVVYLGDSYASGALSVFVRVSRHKTFCMYHVSYCFLLVFVFCLINIFQVQVQVVSLQLLPTRCPYSVSFHKMMYNLRITHSEAFVVDCSHLMEFYHFRGDKQCLFGR